MSSLFPADPQPTPKPEFELELLKQEYFFLQTIIEDWKHFQRGFYPRVAEIERILALDYNLRGPAIFCEWSRAFRRGIIPQRNGYFWDGLFNPSVYVSYALEVVFLLVLSSILMKLPL